MAKSSTKTSAPVAPPYVVARLADQFNELSAAWERADNLHEDEQSARLQCAMNAIITAASHLEARSMKGAAFQIMAASAQADSILNGIEREYREAVEQRMGRLLHRAMQFVGSDDDMPHVIAHLMPWRHKPDGKRF